MGGIWPQMFGGRHAECPYCQALLMSEVPEWCPHCGARLTQTSCATDTGEPMSKVFRVEPLEGDSSEPASEVARLRGKLVQAWAERDEARAERDADREALERFSRAILRLADIAAGLAHHCCECPVHKAGRKCRGQCADAFVAMAFEEDSDGSENPDSA